MGEQDFVGRYKQIYCPVRRSGQSEARCLQRELRYCATCRNMPPPERWPRITGETHKPIRYPHRSRKWGPR